MTKLYRMAMITVKRAPLIHIRQIRLHSVVSLALHGFYLSKSC